MSADAIAPVCVVIPTYDERESLPRLLDRLEDALAGHDVHTLVVDDDSPDGTGALADQRAGPRLSVLHRTEKTGLGPAYRAGFRWALDRGAAVVCQMDADGSHDPAAIPALLDALGDADLAIGSRYVPGGAVVHWPRRRRWLSRGGNLYVRTLTGLPVRDATAGFRAWRAPALQAVGALALQSDGYAFQVETALRAWQADLRITEVPITFVERTEGASKMNRAIVAEALARTAGWGVDRLRDRRAGPRPDRTRRRA